MKQTPKRTDEDYCRPYATNLLIVKENCDPVTGVQNPDHTVIHDAKERVDANEK